MAKGNGYYLPSAKEISQMRNYKRVEIYSDPVTQLHPEGAAYLVSEVSSIPRDAGLILGVYEVVYEEDLMFAELLKKKIKHYIRRCLTDGNGYFYHSSELTTKSDIHKLQALLEAESRMEDEDIPAPTKKKGLRKPKMKDIVE